MPAEEEHYRDPTTQASRSSKREDQRWTECEVDSDDAQGSDEWGVGGGGVASEIVAERAQLGVGWE